MVDKSAEKIVKTVKKKVAPSPAKSDTSEPMIYSQSTTMSIRDLGSFDTVYGLATDVVEAEKEMKSYKDELDHLNEQLSHRPLGPPAIPRPSV